VPHIAAHAALQPPPKPGHCIYVDSIHTPITAAAGVLGKAPMWVGSPRCSATPPEPEHSIGASISPLPSLLWVLGVSPLRWPPWPPSLHVVWLLVIPCLWRSPHTPRGPPTHARGWAHHACCCWRCTHATIAVLAPVAPGLRGAAETVRGRLGTCSSSNSSSSNSSSSSSSGGGSNHQ
jgi:hypothetical protein